MSKDKAPKKEEKTDFQGPVSLDAIFAATSKNKEGDTEKPVAPIVENKEEPVIVPVADLEDKGQGTESVVAQPAPTPVIEPAVQSTDTEETKAFKTAQQLIKLGVLEDFVIQTSEEEENGTAISEFKTMTDENLEEIVKIHKQEKNKDLSSNYISKEGLKEHQLKVIEILQNGGDLSQIAESPDKAFDRPFEGFDMDDQQRQIDVIYTDLVHSKGLKHDKAKSLIEYSIKNGTLKEESKELFDLYRDAHSNYINEKLEEQRKVKEFKDLNFKENKKSLVAKLKEAGFKESVYKKVSTEYSKKTESGDYALLNKVRDILDNPEENFEVILHLADKKLFNETFKIKASQEAQKTIVRLASSAASKGNKKSTKTQPQEVQAPWLKIAELHNSNINK